jgi:hypothetical protein
MTTALDRNYFLLYRFELIQHGRRAKWQKQIPDMPIWHAILMDVVKLRAKYRGGKN